MLTLETVVHCPALISSTRTPWTGTLEEGVRLDALWGRVEMLCERYNVAIYDYDMLCDVLGAVPAELELQFVRDLFDDPNTTIEK